MPTYEFECPDGHQFERFYRKISDGVSELPCPVCGKPAQRKMSAGGGLIFKGSGFYITDYGKDGKKDQTKPSAAKEGGSSSESSTESSAKSDSAPAAGGDSGTKQSSEAKPGPAAKSAEKPAAKKAKDSE